MTRSSGRTRQGLNRLRRGDISGSTQAYLDAGSNQQPIRGDQDGPWIKGPPFVTNREELYYNPSLPPLGDYLFTPDVNVRDYRILTLFIDFEATTNGTRISLIPQVSMDDAGDTFYPIGVVEAAITSIALTDTNVPFEPPFGSRNIYPAEFRTTAAVNGEQVRMSLTFDVGAYNRYRFALGSLGGYAGDTYLSYVLSM